MVCGDTVHGLDRRTQAQMQARIRHEAEALEWEQKFQQQSAGDLDMSFEAFCEIYTNDLKARLKESTWQTKENIIKTKLLPYFGKRKINEITTKDVIAWQNELLAYRDEKTQAIFSDLSQDATQSAQRHFQPRCPVLRSPLQSGSESRKHGDRGTAGDAVLDERRISEIC